MNTRNRTPSTSIQRLEAAEGQHIYSHGLHSQRLLRVHDDFLVLYVKGGAEDSFLELDYDIMTWGRMKKRDVRMTPG